MHGIAPEEAVRDSFVAYSALRSCHIQQLSLNAAFEDCKSHSNYLDNPASPIQLRTVLFEDHTLPVVKKAKTGPSTDKDCLNAWLEMDIEPDTRELLTSLLTFRKDTKSLDLFMSVSNPASSGLDTFIEGFDTSTNDVDNYIQGLVNISGNMDLFISGIPAVSSSVTFYMQGPIQVSGNIDDIIIGHLIASGNSNLFIKGRSEDINAFVEVAANNPSNTSDLFVHGIPSGASVISYISDSATLFINDSGDDPTFDSSWSAFAQVASSIATPDTNTWSAFVKVGNVADNRITLYTNAHASGESPRGTSISGSFNMFMNGLSTEDGDEGLLSEGFSISTFDSSSFAKVHLGLNDILNFYISGSLGVVSTSGTSDLFILGILDVASGSHTLYMNTKESINDSNDLFTFGIQGLESGNISLYIKSCWPYRELSCLQYNRPQHSNWQYRLFAPNLVSSCRQISIAIHLFCPSLHNR